MSPAKEKGEQDMDGSSKVRYEEVQSIRGFVLDRLEQRNKIHLANGIPYLIEIPLFRKYSCIIPFYFLVCMYMH